jgi:hypothetical protein
MFLHQINCMYEANLLIIDALARDYMKKNDLPNFFILLFISEKVKYDFFY